MILAGFGFLSRLHGLSIDNLVEVEMVLADGRVVIVNKEDEPGKSRASINLSSHSRPRRIVLLLGNDRRFAVLTLFLDLWWAIRGGGPAFGIATRYKVKAFPVPVVFAVNLV